MFHIWVEKQKEWSELHRKDPEFFLIPCLAILSLNRVLKCEFAQFIENRITLMLIYFSVGSASPTQPSTSGESAMGGACGGSSFPETTSIMNELPPEVFGKFCLITDYYELIIGL